MTPSRPLLPLLLLALATTRVLAATSFSGQWETIKRDATPEQLYRLLWALPKGGDLHNHLGGAGFNTTWWELATDPRRNGGQTFYTRTRMLNPPPSGLGYRGRNMDTTYWVTIRESAWKALPPENQAEFKALPDLTPEEKAGWMSAIILDQAGEGRDEFFEFTWSRLYHLIMDAHVIPELLVENMKLFGEEGLRYLEFQAPIFNLQDPDGSIVPPEEMARRYEERLARPDAVATGVTVRFLNTVLRFGASAEEDIALTYDFVTRHPGRWVGINMAGREDNDKGYPLRFLDTFRAMRRKYSGVGISIHAGEVDEPNAHVRDTLLLGATRIGHGVNLITQPDTMLLMRDNRFLVEINLVSNQLLEYVDDINLHPFPEYLRFGIPVCLNTDDRGMWDSNMTDEYYTAVTAFNLTWAEIVQLGRASLEYSFAQPEVKERLLAEYDAAVAAFERDYQGGDWAQRVANVAAQPSGYAGRTWGLEWEAR